MAICRLWGIRRRVDLKWVGHTAPLRLAPGSRVQVGQDPYFTYSRPKKEVFTVSAETGAKDIVLRILDVTVSAETGARAVVNA